MLYTDFTTEELEAMKEVVRDEILQFRPLAYYGLHPKFKTKILEDKKLKPKDLKTLVSAAGALYVDDSQLTTFFSEELKQKLDTYNKENIFSTSDEITYDIIAHFFRYYGFHDTHTRVFENTTYRQFWEKLNEFPANLLELEEVAEGSYAEVLKSEFHPSTQITVYYTNPRKFVSCDGKRN